MFGVDLIVYPVLAATSALPGVAIAYVKDPETGERPGRAIPAMVAAVAVSAMLFAAAQLAIGALYDWPKSGATMQRAFYNDWFRGEFRLSFHFALLCAVVFPLAKTLVLVTRLARWISLLALPLTAALVVLVLCYQSALQHAAHLGLRMTIEAATVAAALLLWTLYFLAMSVVARAFQISGRVVNPASSSRSPPH